MVRCGTYERSGYLSSSRRVGALVTLYVVEYSSGYCCGYLHLYLGFEISSFPNNIFKPSPLNIYIFWKIRMLITFFLFFLETSSFECFSTPFYPVKFHNDSNCLFPILLLKTNSVKMAIPIKRQTTLLS